MNKEFTAEEYSNRADVFLCAALDKTRSSVKKLIDEGVRYGERQKMQTVAGNQRGRQNSGVFTRGGGVFGKARGYSNRHNLRGRRYSNRQQAAGHDVHLGNGNTDGTLVNALLFRLNSLSGINGVIRPGIVHRIDKDTSGLSRRREKRQRPRRAFEANRGQNVRKNVPRAVGRKLKDRQRHGDHLHRQKRERQN